MINQYGSKMYVQNFPDMDLSEFQIHKISRFVETITPHGQMDHLMGPGDGTDGEATGCIEGGT